MTAFSDGGVMLRESLRNPGDMTLRMVYADWLDEQAMERGEAIPCMRARFVRMGFHPGWISLTPTEQQMKWLEMEGRDVHFGGECGSGKTVALLMAALRYATEPGYQALLIGMRVEGLLEIARTWLVDTKDYSASWNKWKLMIHLGNGAKIQFGNGNRAERYQGMSVNFVGIDNVANMSGPAVELLKLRARPQKNNLPWMCRTT